VQRPMFAASHSGVYKLTGCTFIIFYTVATGYTSGRE